MGVAPMLIRLLRVSRCTQMGLPQFVGWPGGGEEYGVLWSTILNESRAVGADA